MKRLLLPLLLAAALGLACPFSGGVGTGSQVNALLGDPQVGLDGLHDYRAVLSVSFDGTQDGQALQMTETYLQNEWPAQAAKFTTIDAPGDSGTHQVTLVGSVGEAQYFQADSATPCEVSWGALAGGPAKFRPAFLLPAVGSARLAGTETLDGIAARHYTFGTASLTLPEGATATGAVWIAVDKGYVLKYVLDIVGADTLFGPGVQGTRHLEYLVSEVGAQPEVVYPAGCAPVLDLPAMDGAADLVRLPGLLGYNTDATGEAVLTFYATQLAALGWEKRSAGDPGADSTAAAYLHPASGASATITVDIEGTSHRVTVMVLNSGSAAVPETTPGANATAVAGTPAVRVALALNILFGMVPSQPGPASYHIEVLHVSPVWDGAKIAQRQDAMSADVQGKAVHYTHRKTSAGGSPVVAEAYLIEGQEYAVVNGQVQPAGADSLTWTLWSLDLATILPSGSAGATAAGTEALEGRPAQVYELHSSGLSIPGVGGNPFPITTLTGKVWVDQATGALLKADLDYQADVTDSSGNPQGSGSGHLEIAVTQVGQVTVALP